jgi:hypothetical protein
MVPVLIPVIRFSTAAAAMANANIARDAGCDGVFLVHPEGEDGLLIPVTRHIKEEWPAGMVGIHFKNTPAMAALDLSLGNGLDMTWTDNISQSNSSEASRVASVLGKLTSHLFFDSIDPSGFHQKPPDPFEAATKTRRHRMIPATRFSPEDETEEIRKLAILRSAVGNAALAVASGITVENVHALTPYASHLLFASGASDTFFTLDPELTRAMVTQAKKAWTETGPAWASL